MSGSLELLTQPTARKECLAATGVWSSHAAAYHLTVTRGRYADIPSRVPAVPIHRVLRHCSLCCPSGAVCGLRSGAAGCKDAELVSLWVGKYDPALIARLADVGVPGT